MSDYIDDEFIEAEAADAADEEAAFWANEIERRAYLAGRFDRALENYDAAMREVREAVARVDRVRSAMEQRAEAA